jgi:hypothetical protein
MDIQSQTKKAMFHERDHENTYTNSAKNRMVDYLDEYLGLLEANTQINNYENFLYGKTTRIEKMKHRLADICELTMCSQAPPTHFKIKMNINGAQTALEELFDEADLPNFKLKNMTYHITLSMPTEEKLDELSDKISAICAKQIRMITKVKSETMQRVQKAVQNEFITTIEAVQARRQVEKLHKELSFYFKFLACNGRMKLLNENFKFDDDFSKRDYSRALKMINDGEFSTEEDD